MASESTGPLARPSGLRVCRSVGWSRSRHGPTARKPDRAFRPFAARHDHRHAAAAQVDGLCGRLQYDHFCLAYDAAIPRAQLRCDCHRVSRSGLGFAANASQSAHRGSTAGSWQRLLPNSYLVDYDDFISQLRTLSQPAAVDPDRPAPLDRNHGKPLRHEGSR